MDGYRKTNKHYDNTILLISSFDSYSHRMKMPEREFLTNILSGLMSACMIPHFFRSLRASRSCWAYERTALMWSPTLFPYFFKTSRKFILNEISCYGKQTDFLKIFQGRGVSKNGSRVDRVSLVSVSCVIL